MGTREEFEALALEHLDSMYGYARVLSTDDSDAEDLLQEAFLRAFRAFDRYKRDRSFKGWMLTILRNASLDRARRRRVRANEEPVEDDSGGGGQANVWSAAVPRDPEQILIRNLTIEQVSDAVTRLPRAMREVVLLRDVEGLSYVAISGIIGRPIGTVMSRLYRGRNLLRSMVQESATRSVTPRGMYGL